MSKNIENLQNISKIPDILSGTVDVSFDNQSSDLTSTNIQDAITELDSAKANVSDVYTKSQTDSALILKADQSTTYTKTEVDDAIADLVNSAPSTLDTLNELAAALGNDENFSTTVSASIGLKAPLDSPAFTGTPTAPTPTVNNQVATKEYVDNSTVTTDISITHNASTVVVNSSDGADGTINAATTSVAGIMSAADKTKLDGIVSGGEGATISDDTTTNATYYPTFATATSGTLTTAKVSSTKLTFNPSTGLLSTASDANINSVTVGRGGGNVNGNTANGNEALYNNTTGNENTAIGYRALHDNAVGTHNTATGASALHSNIGGYNNTASGSAALFSNTEGSENTATGREALYFNIYGSNNTANGNQALFSNIDGSENTASGNKALYSNTIGYGNTASGNNALRNNIDGYGNTANGAEALRNNTDGYENTATGYGALYMNGHGTNNTASGSFALSSNTTGGDNTATGSNALSNNIEGYYNTANGAYALSSNTTGGDNTASGYQALYANTTGGDNTASGYQALYNNTAGMSNIADGPRALYNNTTGSNNTAIGYQALRNNTTASYNTAIGYQALRNNTTASYNTAIGYHALYSNTTGTNNTALGTQYSGLTYSPAFDCTTESNRVSIAHRGVTNAYINVAWTVISDERDKNNFTDVPHGLDFVNQLNPVSYERRLNRDTEETDGITRYGFKAQEILALEGANPVIVDNEDADSLRLVDSNLLAVAIKAIKELSAKVDRLETELNTIKG